MCNSAQVNFVARCQEGTLQLSKDVFVAADKGQYLCSCYNSDLTRQPQPRSESIIQLGMLSFRVNFANHSLRNTARDLWCLSHFKSVRQKLRFEGDILVDIRRMSFPDPKAGPVQLGIFEYAKAFKAGHPLFQCHTCPLFKTILKLLLKGLKTFLNSNIARILVRGDNWPPKAPTRLC